MAVTSYGAGARESTGAVRILMDLETDIEGRNVLLVEDIIDSGHTLDYIVRVLARAQPGQFAHLHVAGQSRAARGGRRRGLCRL